MKLEERNGCLGIFAGDKFTPKSNFSLKILGTTGGNQRLRDYSGVIYKVTFPTHPGNNKIDIWVPYETTESLAMFKKHLRAQYRNHVEIRCSNDVWSEYANEMVNRYVQAGNLPVPFAHEIGFQESVFDPKDVKTVKYCFSRETKLDYKGNPDPAPNYHFFPWYQNGGENKDFNYMKQCLLEEISFEPSGKDGFEKLFNFLTPSNKWQSVLTWSAALASCYSSIIKHYFEQFPIFVLCSPEKACGKTTLLKQALHICSDPTKLFDTMTSEQSLFSDASRTTTLMGLEDTANMRKEERILLTSFDGSVYKTKSGGTCEPKAPFMVSSNCLVRAERHSERCCYIRVYPFGHVDGITEKTMDLVALLKGKQRPLDFAYSHAEYVMSDKFKRRVVTATEYIAELCNLNHRTARSYGILLAFKDLLVDLFPHRFQGALGEESWTSFLTEVYTKDIKELHTSEADSKLRINEVLQALMKEMKQLPLTDRLKLGNIVESRQIPSKRPEKIHCFALNRHMQRDRQTSIRLVDDMSLDAFGLMVEKFGGVRMFDALLLKPNSTAICVNRKETGMNKSCVIIPYFILSSETWCRICEQFSRLDLFRLVDQWTPDGVLTQQSQQESQTAEIFNNDSPNISEQEQEESFFQTRGILRSSTQISNSGPAVDVTPDTVIDSAPSFRHDSSIFSQNEPSIRNESSSSSQRTPSIRNESSSLSQDVPVTNEPTSSVTNSQSDPTSSVTNSQSETMCPFDNCSFVAKSKRGLTTHKRKCKKAPNSQSQ